MEEEGKVVGAEMKDVVYLFFWDFVWQVILAGVLGLVLFTVARQIFHVANFNPAVEIKRE